nr:BspA family leucine-rich repeat surface protein [Mycoplasmopsis bovis]
MLRNLNEKIVNLEKWDTSNIESMSKTFLQAKKFNTDISSWKTNSVKDMSNMFTSAEAFSQNLDKWDTSNVTTMNRMFQEAKAFNGDISTWDTKNVRIWLYVFWATTFNKDISAKCWNVSTMESKINQISWLAKVKKQNAQKFNNQIQWNTSTSLNKQESKLIKIKMKKKELMNVSNHQGNN